MKHRILNNPIGIIVLAIVSLLVLPIPGSIIEGTTGHIVTIIMAFIGVYLLKRSLRDEGFKGILVKDNIKFGFLLLIPLFIYLIIGTITSLLTCELTLFNNMSLEITLSGISAAIIEEVSFRGIIITGFMRKALKNNPNNKIIIIMIISGVIFGLIHLTNLYAGASIDSTIIQVIGTICSGCFLASVFLRTGNLWFPIIGHCLNNIIASLDTSNLNANGAMVGSFTPSDIVILILGIMLLIFAFYYVRKEKQAEIIEIWENKWTKL